MSATDTVRLVRYQGARARWAARSWAGWPWWAYQTIARLMQTSPNGTRRSTERRVRVRAWPTPARWRASRNAVSTVESQLANSAARDGGGCGWTGRVGRCGCDHLLVRLSLLQQHRMAPTWPVRRQISPHRDGDRRWDQAYHLLVRWAMARPDGDRAVGPMPQEVPDAHGGVCAGLHQPPSPGADHRAAA